MIKTEDYTREILTIVFAQKKIIFGVSLGITVCAVLIAFFWPPTYKVESKILIKGKKLEKSPETLEAAQLRMFELSREDLMSEMAIIVSPNVIRRTILALASDGRMFPEAGSSEEALEKIRHDIDDALTTIIIPDSNIIKVILAGRDPDKLMMLMRELGRQYTRYRAAIFNPDTALVFFSSRVDKYDSELKAQEQKLIALSYQYQSADPGKEIDNNLLLQKSLEDRLVTVQAALTDKNSHIQSVRRALGNDEIQFFSFLQVLSINQLSEKLQGLLVEKSETLRVYLDQSSKAQGLARQIQQVYAALKNEVANYLYDQAQEKAALEQQAEAIRTRLKHINARNLELHAYMMTIRDIQRKIDLLDHKYETFAKRLEEVTINTNTAAADIFSVSMLSDPFFCGHPLFPQKDKVILIGVIAGIVLGLSLGFLREYLDHTFKRPEDIIRFAELPVLFTLKRW